jgi:hypothetical protein
MDGGLTAVSITSPSSLSTLPPGKAVCPGCERSSFDRVVNRTWILPARSYNKTSTAASLEDGCGVLITVNWVEIGFTDVPVRTREIPYAHFRSLGYVFAKPLYARPCAIRGCGKDFVGNAKYRCSPHSGTRARVWSDSEFRRRLDGAHPILCVVQCDKVSFDKIRFDNKSIHLDGGRTATT